MDLGGCRPCRGCTGAAAAASATAIFPFEIYDTSGEPPRPDLTERLARATRVLSEALEKPGRYLPSISERSAPMPPRRRRVICAGIVSC